MEGIGEARSPAMEGLPPSPWPLPSSRLPLVFACNGGGYLIALKCVASVAEWSRRLSVAQEITGSNPVARPKQRPGSGRVMFSNGASACSSMDRALGFGPRGCGFESCRARHIFHPPVLFAFSQTTSVHPHRICCRVISLPSDVKCESWGRLLRGC